MKQTLTMQRQEQILLTIDELGYASRKQIQRLFDLETRNTQLILQQMGEYLNSFRHFDNVYYLNKKGRERIGSDKVRQKPYQVDHVLLRNEVYLLYQPQKWNIEKPVLVNNETFIVPDVTFIRNGEKCFLEVDNTQKMIENRKKVRRYEELNEIYQRNKKPMPKLLWVTISDHRQKKLQEYSKNLHALFLTDKDF